MKAKKKSVDISLKRFFIKLKKKNEQETVD